MKAWSPLSCVSKGPGSSQKLVYWMRISALAGGSRLDAPVRLSSRRTGRELPAASRGAEIRDASAEVANLVQRIPRRHLHRYVALRALRDGDGHGHVKLVPLGMRQGNVIANRRPRGRGQR